jgi:hypothetical protein
MLSLHKHPKGLELSRARYFENWCVLIWPIEQRVEDLQSPR